jgi:hypothetical protein
MKIILNYTGKRIGIANEYGNPIQVLPSNGNARLENITYIKEGIVDLIPYYRKETGRVRGLPTPDINYQKLYIVSRDVAEAFGSTRFDLLVPEEPVKREGTTYYKKLIAV